MSKHSHRHRTAKMIRAAAQSCGHPIECMVKEVEWIQAADGADASAPKRFKMRAYTGGPMQVNYYDSPVVIDMAGLTAKPPVPILMNHSLDKIVGHADDVQTSDSALDLSGAVSGASPEALQVLASAKQGFPWKASIGARPDKMEFVGEGATCTVNGKTFTGPLYVARKSTLGEVSFVPMAADSKTSVKVAASAAFSSKESAMNFEQWIEALFCGAVPELRDDQRDKLQTAYNAEVKAAAAKPAIEGAAKPAVAAPTFDLSGVIRAYEIHIATVEAKAATYVGKIEAAGLAEIRAKAGTAAADLKLKALNEEWAPARMEVALVKAQAEAEVAMIRAERPKGPGIHSSTQDIKMPVIEAAMCQTLGTPNVEEQFSDETLQAAHTTFRGRLGLQQTILMAAAANGFSCGPGERIHNGNIREVIDFAFPRDIRAAQASTINLPSIFSNVANKELLAGFMEEDQAWREIAVTRNVSDFKQVTSYRMLDNMEYEELPPGGEIKHGQVGEETYTRQAKTYAKMFALDRTDIVNDDMGALDDLRTRLGRGAARKFNKVFWAAFISNSSFFTAARGNYISGATTTLLTDYVGLGLGVAAFDALKSAAVPPSKVGEKIGGVATILLVPPELEAVAMQIMAPIAAAKASDVNIYSSRYAVRKVSQLSDSTYSGSSATAWYLLRNPAVLAAIVVSLLNGNANPVVESAEASFDRLGVEFRGYHDFGCDKAEWLCGVKSKGAA